MTLPLKASEVDKRVVALVQFGPPAESSGMRPGEYYQVTIDPYLFSSCGSFIRVGNHPGDELVGWQNADRLYVVSILAEWPDEMDVGMLELTWGESPALSN